MGGGGFASAGVVCACGWLCRSHDSVCVAPTRAMFGRVPGVPQTAPAEKTLHPYLGRQDCVVVWLPTPPPTEGQGWHGLDLGRCQPLFLCPPTPPRGGRDFSTCLVLSPPDQGGDVGHYRLRALVSATLWAVLPFWHCLVSRTPSLSYMPLMTCAVCSSPPWQTLCSDDKPVLDFSLFIENLVENAMLDPADLHNHIIAAGARWSGSGYGQGTLSRLIHDFTKVGVLATTSYVYRDIVLVGLALYRRINSIPKALEEDTKDAALALCDALTKHAQSDQESAKDQTLPWVDEPLRECFTASYVTRVK